MAEVEDVSVLAQLPRVWGYDELVEFLDGFPDVDARRYEIIDGFLAVTPSPDVSHEVISALLRDLLSPAARPEHLVIGPVDVDLRPSYRAPDLVVVAAAARQERRPLPPALVALAVEIVSPSSVTDDRIVKPAQYAAHGIPMYLRVETDPVVTLTAYDLRPGDTAYTEIGTWGPGETARLERPFPVLIPIDEITP